ncbi:N amino acid transport system protein [Pseudocercospora fuligena]|uniref:N amino acid transport system protein n=1 Tax=Pseudocercospora fuligena TaxID=685502 RepID=A0A8H6VQT7_9PEZI|nr:N amino acid transport system protein [Pseudocercospora fuligena]
MQNLVRTGTFDSLTRHLHHKPDRMQPRFPVHTLNMSKRKHDGDMHPNRKLRAAPSPERYHRTVAQITTGSIGIHRVAFPRASLLGLPREIRDLIDELECIGWALILLQVYSYVPHEISCVPEDSQSCRIRYPHDVSPYTNDTTAPAMYEGVSIGSQMVDELAQLSTAKRWHRHPMFSVCRQISEEYLDTFRQRNFQAQRIHFLVRNFNFETVIQVIKEWRPSHVVIELCDEYYWQEGAVRNLPKWYQTCKTPSLARLDEAEIDGHRFRLTYQRELKYHSPSLLARGRRRQVGMLRDTVHPRASSSWMPLTVSGFMTREAIRRHVSKAIEWIDRYNGYKAQAWKGCIKAAKRDVKIARKNKPKSGLLKTSKLLGRKRDFEDMEADAKMRAVVKRWAALKFQPTMADFRAAEARAASEILGEAGNREHLAEQVSVGADAMVGVQTQKDIELENILEQLGKMDIKGLGGEQVDADDIGTADEMEIEPKEVVNEKGSSSMDLKVVIEQISKLNILSTGSTANARHFSECHSYVMLHCFAFHTLDGEPRDAESVGLLRTALARLKITTILTARITPSLYATGASFGTAYETTSAIGNMSSDDASSKGSKQRVDVGVEMVALEAQRSNTTGSTKTTGGPSFGYVEEGQINYENTGWKLAAFLMMKTQVGIGALSIPGAFETLGLIPGLFVLIIVAIMTTWSNHMAGRFCLKHKDVFSLDQAGKEMFGGPGEYILLACLMLYYIFTAGSALVSVSTCLNALSEHGACTAAFIAVAAIVAFCLASVPKIAQIGWFAPVAMMFIVSSLFTVSIAVSLQRPAAAPQTGPWSSDYKLFASPSFPQAMAAVSTIIFSFTGTPYFFTIFAEMRVKKDYFKSMYLCQSVVFSIYAITGIMVYYFCGSYVTSPALGSAGRLIKKVAYGLGLPGLVITSMIVCHVPAKTLFLRCLAGTIHVKSKTWQHWTVWFSCTSGVVLVAYIIASAVPGFSSLVSLIGALFGTLIVLQPYAMMWWYDERHRDHSRRNRRWYAAAVWASFIFVAGCFCTVSGTWGALQKIIQAYQADAGSVWSCADNSGSK